MSAGEVSASWLPASSDASTSKALTYELHAKVGAADFVPDSTTRRYSGSDVSAVLSGLAPGETYTLKLVVIDPAGNRYLSTAKSIQVSIATPLANANVQTISAAGLTQPINEQTGEIRLAASEPVPVVGGYVVSSEGDGFLGKVSAVSPQTGGGTIISTSKATLSEIASNLSLATSISLLPVPQAQSASKLSAQSSSTQNAMSWQQTGFKLSSAPTLRSTKKLKPAGLVSVTSSADLIEATGTWGKLSVPGYVTAVDIPGTNSQFQKVLYDGAPPDIEFCKYEVIDDENDGNLASAGAFKDSNMYFTTDGIEFGVYRVKVRAYLDKRGDECSGDDWTARWEATPEISFDVAVSTGNKFQRENKKFSCNNPDSTATFTCSANFEVENDIDYSFDPELKVAINFDRRVGIDGIKDASFVVASQPEITQKLHVKATAAGTLNRQTVALISERKFAKTFAVAGVPVIVTGQYWVDFEIEGNATGEIDASELIKLGFEKLEYGLKYDGATDQWSVVAEKQPRYTVELNGTGDVKATVSVAVVPRLAVKIYQYPTARLALRPSLTGIAGLHGQVAFNATNEGVTKEADYWLTEMTLAGQIDGYFYAAIESMDNKPYKNYVFPKSADPEDYLTFHHVELVGSTTFVALPALASSPLLQPALKENTRAMQFKATAAPLQSPFRRFVIPFGPETFLNFDRFVDPKVIALNDRGYGVVTPADPAAHNFVLGSGIVQNQWIEFTEPGTYTVRVGGYSKMGSWARQVAEDIVLEIKDDNANTIMDYWEDRYALQGTGEAIAQGDPDGDGRRNLREWQDGTDPLVPDNLGTLNVSNTTPGFGEAIQVWLADVWAGVTNVVFSFTDTVVSVINGATERVSAIFSTTGIQTITATLRDAVGDTVGTLTQVITVGAPNVSAQITTVQDDSATPATDIANNSTTEDATPVIRGTIGASLPAGFEVRLFKDGETDSFGVATVDGLNWSYTVPADQPLSNGVHSITAGVVRAVDGSTEPGPRSAPYSFTVQAVGVFDVEPKQVMRAKSTVFTFSGQGLPTSGLTITAPGNSRNTCQINAAGNSATGFNATCSFFTLGAQTLQISQGSRVLGTLELDVTSNITDVSWASGSSTTFGKGTVKFGEMVTYRVSGEHLLVDTNLGFAVDRCGVANTEIGTGTDVLRTYQCWFNNEAGAVAGQMSGVVKDAPNGQALYYFQVPVETAPIDANSSIVVSWDLGSVGTPIQGRGTNPRTVAINAGVEIEGFLNGPAFDVDVSNDKVRLFNFRNYAGYPGSAVFDASAFNGLVLRVPSGASWTFTSASVGSANTLSGLTAIRLDAQAQRLAINLAGLVYDASTVVEVAYGRGSATPVSAGKLPHSGITANQCYAAGGSTLLACSEPGALALNSQQDGHRANINAMSYSQVGSYPITSCVKDNVTGLIWEGKEASGTRAGSNTYTNYQVGYLGTQAQMDAATNTYGYVAAVNAMALCGHTDWRLPTVDELQTIVDYGRFGPAINTAWFPNSPSNGYWASSPYVGYSDYAWYVNFSNGYVSYNYRHSSGAVRLVRASQ